MRYGICLLIHVHSCVGQITISLLIDQLFTEQKNFQNDFNSFSQERQMDEFSTSSNYRSPIFHYITRPSTSSSASPFSSVPPSLFAPGRSCAFARHCQPCFIGRDTLDRNHHRLCRHRDPVPASVAFATVLYTAELTCVGCIISPLLLERPLLRSLCPPPQLCPYRRRRPLAASMGFVRRGHLHKDGGAPVARASMPVCGSVTAATSRSETARTASLLNIIVTTYGSLPLLLRLWGRWLRAPAGSKQQLSEAVGDQPQPHRSTNPLGDQ